MPRSGFPRSKCTLLFSASVIPPLDLDFVLKFSLSRVSRGFSWLVWTFLPVLKKGRSEFPSSASGKGVFSLDETLKLAASSVSFSELSTFAILVSKAKAVAVVPLLQDSRRKQNISQTRRRWWAGENSPGNWRTAWEDIFRVTVGPGQGLSSGDKKKRWTNDDDDRR